MIQRLFASAFGAGLIAGLMAAAIQILFVVPLIMEAERYETGELAYFPGAEMAAPHAHATEPAVTEPAVTESVAAEPVATVTPAPAADAHDHDHHHAAPGGGDLLARHGQTLLASVVTYAGFGLLLVAGFALAERRGVEVSARSGLLWGLAGFAAFQFAPAAGLAPELPGSGAAALEARQLWWVLAAACTAGGIAALALSRSTVVAALGVVLIAFPHLIGAPQPHAFEGVVPPELSALFASRSLAVGAVAWALLGLSAGHFWSRAARFARPQTA